jgi:hypothetical protein
MSTSGLPAASARGVSTMQGLTGAARDERVAAAARPLSGAGGARGGDGMGRGGRELTDGPILGSSGGEERDNRGTAGVDHQPEMAEAEVAVVLLGPDRTRRKLRGTIICSEYLSNLFQFFLRSSN